MEDAHVIEPVSDDKVDLSLQVGGMIYFTLIFQRIDLFANALACRAEFFVFKNLVFLRQSQQSKQIQLRMFLLPHLESDKCHEMTGKDPVDSKIFSDDLLTEHPRIFILALFVSVDIAVGDEIIPRIDNSSVCVKAITLVIHVIAHYIKTRPIDTEIFDPFVKNLNKN